MTTFTIYQIKVKVLTFKQLVRAGAPGVTGKYSFAVYDCGLLPVEWIHESQSQTLDASVLAQLGLPSLPPIQP